MALHGLGVVEQKRNKLDKAEQLYRSALKLEKQRHAIAVIYTSLDAWPRRGATT
jgi:hypothetical protein